MELHLVDRRKGVMGVVVVGLWQGVLFFLYMEVCTATIENCFRRHRPYQQRLYEPL